MKVCSFLILFSLDFRFLRSCGSWKHWKTDMIYQDQHIHYMQVVCNFLVKIKFWREIILPMTFAYIYYVGDSCVTFFNRSGDHAGPRSNQRQKLTYFSVELTFAPLSLQIVQYAFQEWNIEVCTSHRKWTFSILGQIFRQIVSIRVMILMNTNIVASRHIKR